MQDTPVIKVTRPVRRWLAGIAVAALVSLTVSCTSQEVQALSNAMAAATAHNVVNGTITVSPGTHQDYPVTVTTGMSDAKLDGSFTASGGSGNDIIVMVMDATNYANWENNHTYSCCYNSGQITTGQISAYIGTPGTYYVIYSNMFSVFSTKQVTTRVDLHY